ncbi:60S ribosomal protein L21, putative [Perkinsus marinus ATCC 50983]|uniref:60S ribosomal protein L21, putative n=1 Tax=Perkinsus marinus (strain ATCC 50983 / TXsc) TaxID=423536 RepID=C5K9S4_PERM5|nr:60S ribosomal protein L21, putative [Perkinsus marinus ATCC 50983]XP_002785752.1 60S ribosomal protein L21, putative [Perkinsus marinus ATCC 50983]XP_002787050.1 60S ribosomal protein L21, putative [Perkinsus marinus ATCC 50983]EER09975.1 60S ribosomal protein L21, putative [Perkinsus marinus ATCC 50983]EER17548.1 60S ribosomal protein L21, putative [Perkinsus marinus ATCC 50983]EER18846.1 60S ribosomal protein L21, putative [Perkinsus marinus ATCC 50983]|mmetsp:Transcript_13595/g.13398  ORF Transcript_13595/g.13398 Transcript_13595/m.13398 type:complete len:166 (+) Transcript_13595:37-534(+)|eukprot:XP_002778180.1 60S ribosomal protein L21, putative [Perkinsus marinus ATCC 50983]
MPHSFGLRARTRDKFSKGFREKGLPNLTRYLTPFKRGDFVDIVADASIQRGMPYQFYHGRTGVVFNVTQKAVGVEVTKVVGNRQLRKRLHVRIEHVRKSRCNEAFLNRVKANDALKHDAKVKGEKVITKRETPGMPKSGKIVKVGRSGETKVHVLEALPYVENYF